MYVCMLAFLLIIAHISNQIIKYLWLQRTICSITDYDASISLCDEIKVCENKVEWKDTYYTTEVNCADFEVDISECAYGEFYSDSNDVTANEACCVCGGGSTGTVKKNPSFSCYYDYKGPNSGVGKSSTKWILHASLSLLLVHMVLLF